MKENAVEVGKRQKVGPAHHGKFKLLVLIMPHFFFNCIIVILGVHYDIYKSSYNIS
jgi:hypothetical protein